MKDGGGFDNLAIAWQRPRQTLIEVIPANFSTPLIPCPPDWMAVEVKVTADYYPDEISWTLVSKCETGVFLSSYTDYSWDVHTYSWYFHTVLSATACLPTGEYEFTINDAAGDGICCNFGQGEYDIFVNGIIKHTGGQFGSNETKSFGACPSAESISLTRKVRMQLGGQNRLNFLHLREVEVWDQNGTNVALNKTAIQSSTFAEYGSTFPASNAVDGIVDISFEDMSHTNFDQGEYHLLAHD